MLVGLCGFWVWSFWRFGVVCSCFACYIVFVGERLIDADVCGVIVLYLVGLLCLVVWRLLVVWCLMLCFVGWLIAGLDWFSLLICAWLFYCAALWVCWLFALGVTCL